MSQDLFYFSGVGEDGYAVPPMNTEALGAIFQDMAPTSSHVRERFLQGKKSHLDVVPWADARQLDQTGWGVIFASKADPRLKEQLKPLLDLRRKQAGERYRCFEGDAGNRNGESVDHWLARHKSGRGPVNPDKVPYYLMIVGSPADIPYEWQYQLDIQFAVGRIHFPNLEDYAAYAATVCQAAEGSIRRDPETAIFAPTHAGDHLCDLTVETLARPMGEGIGERHSHWICRTFLGPDANKQHLRELMGSRAPAFLFTAGHGFMCRRETALNDVRHGSLVCSDWQGQGMPTLDELFTADDVVTNPSGLIAFLFGCYSSGSPDLNPFWREADQERSKKPETPFIARLPQTLLTRGALACIGHVEQAWVFSYVNSYRQAYPTHFHALVHRLLQGYPVGAAMEAFNQRHAESAAALTTELERVRFGANKDWQRLVKLWTTYHDARAYTVVGDPAVTLAVKEG